MSDPVGAMPSIAATPSLDELSYQAAPTQPAVPPLSFFDKFKLGMQEKRAGPDWGFNQMDWHENALDEVRDALRKKGITPVDVMATADGRPGETPPQTVERHWRELFDQVARARQAEPNILPDFASVVDRNSFNDVIRQRRQASAADVAARAPDGLGVPGFLGSIAESFKDPLSYLPIGGVSSEATSIGGRILRQALAGAAINAGMTVASEPLVRIDAARIGQQRTAGDFVADLLASTAIGAGVGGGFEGIGIGAEKIHEVFSRAAQPPPPGTPFEGFDSTVAKAFSELVPEDQRTPDERAALHAIERDAEVKATSPFVPNPAGEDAHAAHLDRGMAALNGAPQAQRTVKPIARELISDPADVENARTPARELLKAKIHRAEGDGANTLGSGALGPYQFVPRTWVSLFKRRYPNDTRSFDEIAALRRDPHLNDVLINDLIGENAAALRHAGFEESAGNLYLAHVLGHDRAITVLRAASDAKLGDLLPHDYFAKNPFKAGDSAESLVKWAYGKMGDESVPVHVAAAPEGAAATEQGFVGPDVDIPTGEHVVDALFGDPAMTDRPILRPELFGSPEEHAAAQVRFEREADMAEGYAPVMSRAEAFNPHEYRDALKAYRGKVTPEAIGEALGISPEEVKRAVGAMQSIDPNSPFVLTRGRPAKLDKMGNVTREGTEPGRVIRRPPKPVKANQSLLEYLSANGGLKDKGGELKSMDAQLWHQGAPFRRQLIQEHGMALDDAFEAAIEAGFFPEHTVSAERYADLPDVATFLEAIDEEMRGKPRYRIDDGLDAAEEARRARFDPEQEAAIEQRFMPRKMSIEEIDSHVGYGDYEQVSFRAHDRGLLLDDDVLVEAAQRWGDGHDIDAAIDDAIMTASIRDLEEFAALAGDMGYEPGDDVAAYIGSHAEVRGADGPVGEDGSGGGRSAAAAGGEGASRAALEAAANDPKRAEFGEPAGVAAEAQADSLVHDLEMAAAGGGIRAVLDRKDRLALRQRWLGEQRQKLGEVAAVEKLHEAELADKEPWLEPDYLLETYRDDPDGSSAILEALAEHEAMKSASYRLDEEGGESDLASILDEINEAQKAAAEMRNCLKPKGGDE